MALFSRKQPTAAARRTASRLRFEPLETRLAMAFTAVGAPIQVSTKVADETDMAMDAQGNFVVVWQEFSGSGNSFDSNVFARRYDRLGTPQGDAFQVNTLDNNPEAAQIDMTPDGRFVVTWSSGFTGPLVNSIFVRAFSSDGISQGAEVQVNIPDGDSAGFPDVAVNDAEALVVVWEDYSGSGRIHARQFDAALQPLGGEIRVDDGARCCTLGGADVAIFQDGGFVVDWAWSNNFPPRATSGQGVRQFDRFGHPLSDPSYLLEDVGASLNGLVLTGAIDSWSAGSIERLAILSAYAQESVGYLDMRLSNSASLTLNNPIRIASNSVGFKGLNVAGSPNGIVVFWGEVFQLKFRVFTADGIALSEVQNLQTGNAFDSTDQPGLDASEDRVVIGWIQSGRTTFQRFSFNPLQGDVNGDERVNLQDFAILRSNFGLSDKQRNEGDLTGDGNVEFDDFKELRTNFGRRAKQEMAPLPAPPIPANSTSLGAIQFSVLADGVILQSGQLPSKKRGAKLFQQFTR